jgi:type I restriction enzyme S subunit
MRIAKLGEIAAIDRRSIDPSAILPNTHYLGLEHLNSDGSISPVAAVNPGDLASSKFRFTEAHVLYGKLRPYLRKIVRPTQPGICSTDILPILPGPEINRDYLYHFLRLDRSVALAASLSAGANLPRLSPSVLESFEIPLPPLPEQRRIAAILDHADALRAKRRAAIAKLDSVAQSIFLDMFGDLLSQDHGFETATISECCEAVNDCPHSTPLWTATGVRCIRTSNLSAGDWDWTDERFVSEDTYHERSRRGYLSSGDIVLSREGTVGIAAIVPDNFMGCMGQRLVQLKPNPKRIDSQYLLTYLLSVLRPERIGQFMIGSTSQHLNVGELREIRVPLPPLFEQERFSHRRNRVLQLRLRQMQMAADMTTMMESLQHRAFQGTL